MLHLNNNEIYFQLNYSIWCTFSSLEIRRFSPPMIYFRSELSVAFPFISTKNVVLPIVYNIYILYILFAINLDTFVNILKNICLLKIIFHYFKILVLRYKKKTKSFSYTHCPVLFNFCFFEYFFSSLFE